MIMIVGLVVFGGKFEFVSYNDEEYLRLQFNDESHNWFKKKLTVDGMMIAAIMDGETRRLLEGLWFNQVKHGKYDDVVDEPEYYDEVEWDEKDNSKPMDEVIARLTEKWKTDPPEFLKFELGKTMEDLITRWWDDIFSIHSDWDSDTSIADLVDQIEMWMPREQSAEGSQSVSVIDAVDGYNDALTKIKSKLRNKR